MPERRNHNQKRLVEAIHWFVTPDTNTIDTQEVQTTAEHPGKQPSSNMCHGLSEPLQTLASSQGFLLRVHVQKSHDKINVLNH
jgi:hypothetical protein